MVNQLWGQGGLIYQSVKKYIKDSTKLDSTKLPLIRLLSRTGSTALDKLSFSQRQKQQATSTLETVRRSHKLEEVGGAKSRFPAANDEKICSGETLLRATVHRPNILNYQVNRDAEA